jgi:hypothetical protein
VLGPPQGIWEDIPPIGEPVVHAPVYKHRGWQPSESAGR